MFSLFLIFMIHDNYGLYHFACLVFAALNWNFWNLPLINKDRSDFYFKYCHCLKDFITKSINWLVCDDY